MAFCRNCGYKNDDTSAFCINCGSVFGGSAEKKVENTPRVSENPVLKTIKQTGSGALMLIMTVLFGLAVLLGFFSVLRSLTILLNYFSSGERIIGINDYELYNAPYNCIIDSFILVPQIFIFAGLCKIFSKSREKSDYFDTTGFTVINVITMIRFVISCLAIIWLSFGLASFVLRFGFEDLFAAEKEGFVILIAMAVLILAVLYYIFASLSVKNVKRSAQTGTVTGKVSVFVIVMNFIIAFFGIVYLILVPFMTDVLYDASYTYDRDLYYTVVAAPDVLSYISVIVSVLAIIFASALMLLYNSRIKALRKSAMPLYNPNPYGYNAAEALQEENTPMDYNKGENLEENQPTQSN